MKTKLYIFLTGLLMAACITANGQEIVSRLLYHDGYMFSNFDLAECSDGTLLTGIYYYNYNYEERGILVCKTSLDGQLIDSVRFNYGSKLFSLNGETDSFVIPDFPWDEANSTLSFRMTFIDADLNVTNEVIVPNPFGTYFDTDAMAVEDILFDPFDNFIITYWTDLVINDYWSSDGVFHLMRIGLDGTVISENDTEEVLPPNWSNTHVADSALTFWGESFRVFTKTPLCYYKLGGYIGTDDNHPWPLYTYFFDEDLNLTNTIVYDYLEEDTYYDWAGSEHLVPFEKSIDKEANTYLMAAQIHYPNGRFESSLVKYDMNHNVLDMTRVEASPNIGSGSPIQTIVADENTIFHAYNSYASTYNRVVRIARLDSDLNILWNITLPGGQANYGYGNCMITLQNGYVAIAFMVYGNSSDRLYLYIVRDDYDSTPETTSIEHPFTLYPNPVKDHLSLRFDDGAEPESVELYDLAGRLVGTKPNDLESIDMSTMSSGVYTLRVTMKDGTCYHEKIVKE